MLDRLLDAVRAGESRAVMVRGEPGIGKTALLEYLVERAADCRIARAGGVQSEMELAFAGLHQLCAPMLELADRLPTPQCDALRTVFGLNAGSAPDQFLVGLAVLGLLAEAAADHPLVCVVDDAQWLDCASAQALAFAARRLRAESVALVVAARTPGELADWTGVPELVLAGLPDDEARALLLDSVLPRPVDEQVLDRIVAETRGNPLALLELPRGLSPAELAGVFGSACTTALPHQIEDTYKQRLAGLTSESRLLLLVAAAEPTGDPVLLWRAAASLGIGVEAAAPTAVAGMLEIAARVRFRHPLVRSAIYSAASPENRRRAHGALAAATDPEVDPDRRAWHAAQATAGPDEHIAADLEGSAARARARGGLAATAAFLERAAVLTPDPVGRAERMLAAAQATHQAGSSDTALKLLSQAEAGPLDGLHRARVELLRGQIAFAMHRDREAPSQLLRAAKALAPLDARLARETYLDALLAARFAGAMGGNGGVREVAEAAAVAPPAPEPARAVDLLLDGLTARSTEGYVAGAPIVKRALRAFREEHVSGEEALRWLHPACISAADLWDDETWYVLSSSFVQYAREAGALTVLPLALTTRIIAHTFAGELTEAASLAEEQKAVTEATGIRLALDGALLLVGWQGCEAAVTALTADELKRDEGLWLNNAALANAVLCNGLGRYEDALVAARRVSAEPTVGVAFWKVLVELVEAAARNGEAKAAAEALDLLSTSTQASGTDWALGIEARSRALLSEGQDAENVYREAINRLGRTRVRGELARAHLLHGEWLRRERRRIDAREQLRTAHQMFTAMGMEAFAQRAARELLATGETTRKRTDQSSTELTAQETQIARLVREGLTNTEISVRLVISPRTVEWHLTRMFGKLGITSRRQL